MAHVNHNNIHKGHSYLYEHYRDGKQIKSVYLGSAGNVRTVDSIPAKGYPVEAECYKEGHQAGINAEIEVYGEERYNEFNKHIKEAVPKGELAGSHTEEGEILIHKNIDPKYHKQLILHEKTELDYMAANVCKAEGAKPRTETISNRRVEAALRHKDKLGAGAKRRRELNLTPQEHTKAVLAEYDRGTLHTSSGKLVTSREQALAISYSEIRQKEKQ